MVNLKGGSPKLLFLVKFGREALVEVRAIAEDSNSMFSDRQHTQNIWLWLLVESKSTLSDDIFLRQAIVGHIHNMPFHCMSFKFCIDFVPYHAVGAITAQDDIIELALGLLIFFHCGFHLEVLNILHVHKLDPPVYLYPSLLENILENLLTGGLR